MIDSTIGRRRFLALAGAAAAVAAGPANGKQRSSLDLAKPEDRFRAYMLMRGALDERLVIGFISGRYFGVVDGDMMPLYGVVGVTFTKYRRRGDGGYDAVTAEQAYFTDLESGEWISRYQNPYTGETVDVPTTDSKPARLVFRPDLSMHLAEERPGLQFSDRLFPMSERAGVVSIAQQTRTTAAFPGMAKPFRYSELVELRARRNTLEAPGVISAGCETIYTSVVNWRPWLKMGDRPGHLLGTGVGAYGATIATLPANWVAATRKHRPALLTDPDSAIAAIWQA